MKARGKVHKYGDNVDTDVIIPARYLNTADMQELAKHCMEDIDIDFAKNVKAGDIMVGEANFGCGSSREHAPAAIKASAISCVIAKTFARIFYRNAINIGLPIIECEEASEKIENGDEGVAIGYYLRVLIVLGLEEDLHSVAQDDILGRKLQDAGLTISKRVTKAK